MYEKRKHDAKLILKLEAR